MSLMPTLPAPFTSETAIDLTIEAGAAGFQLQGSFSASLELPGAVAPVAISIGAVFSNDAETNVTSMLLRGTTSSAITIPDVPCLVIGPLVLDAAVEVTPAVAIHRLLLSGEGDLVSLLGCGA